MHTYAGDPTNFPTDMDLPDDGDQRDAASVNVPFEALADRTAYLFSNKGFDQALHVEASDDGSTWTSWDSLTSQTYTEIGGGGFRIDGDAFGDGNHLHVTATIDCYISGGIGAMVRIVAGPAGGPYTALPGARVHVTSSSSSAPDRLHLQGFYAITADGTYDVLLQWRALEPAETVHAIGDANIDVVIV